MDNFDYENEIIEIGNDDIREDITEPVEILEKPSINDKVEEKVKKKKHRRSLKEIWMSLTKKKKISIIVSFSLILLLIIGLILYFVLFRKKDKEEIKEEPVIVEKDNYRYENGKLVFLNKSDKEIGSYECKIKDSEKCLVTKLDYSTDTFERIKSIDEKGNELEKSSQIYLDNYVFVSDDNKIVLYNIKTKESELDLKSIKSYSTEKNLVVIEDSSNKYGLIEITEEGYDYLIRPTYDNLGIANTKLVYLIAKDKDETYIIDSTGKKLSKNILINIESLNDKYIVGSKNKTYYLYTYNNEEMLSDYDYISLHDNVVALVKSNKLYLKDSDLNKLYEEGIRLDSKDYVKEYVYENNKLIETKKAYDISVKDNTASITIGENIQNVNTIIGIVNSKYSYLNYFDGKLYFYSDVEKDDLIGSYACTNKNEITSSNSELSNCIIYKDGTNISGIYNNEFVIISDNSSNSETKYYLYNIKENKNKGTYSEIKIVNDSELSNEIKQIYTSSSLIIAKTAVGANKGNYGVLEIVSGKVNGKIEFKYESIIKDKGYYLFINVDKSYSLYDDSFNKISNEFNYIELFDRYYVGIKDNKLNVYSYSNKLGILESDLEVKSNSFKIDFNGGFNITIDGVTYNYDNYGKVLDGEDNNAEEG